MSDSVAGGIAGAGLGGLMGYGVTDAGLRGARRSRNRLVRSVGRARGFRQGAAMLAGMTAAGAGGAAGSMLMGGHTWFNGVPKEASLLPSPSQVLPTHAGSLARAVKPATIAKNVKSMHMMPAKIAGVLSTVLKESDQIIPALSSMGGTTKKPKGAKPMPKVAFVKKIALALPHGKVSDLGAKAGGLARKMVIPAAVGAAGFAAGRMSKKTEKNAEDQMSKFEFVKKAMGSHGGMSGQTIMSSGATHGGMAGGGKKKKYVMKKKAGEKTAASAEGQLENGSLSAAMAAFLGIKSDDIRMAIDTSPDGDNGRR